MLGSPQVYRERNFSFQVFFNEGSEPPHVHVVRGDGAAKVWLDPVSLCWNRGFNRSELRWILQRIAELHTFFMEQWNAIQTQAR